MDLYYSGSSNTVSSGDLLVNFPQLDYSLLAESISSALLFAEEKSSVPSLGSDTYYRFLLAKFDQSGLDYYRMFYDGSSYWLQAWGPSSGFSARLYRPSTSSSWQYDIVPTYPNPGVAVEYGNVVGTADYYYYKDPVSDYWLPIVILVVLLACLLRRR